VGGSESMEKVSISKRTILFSLMTIVILVALYLARTIFLTSLIGIGFGILIAPVLSKFRNRLNFPRSLSAILVFIFIILFLGGIGAIFYFLVADQVSSLLDNGPQLLKQLETWFSDLFDRFPQIKQQVKQADITGTLGSSFKNLFQGFQKGIMALSGLLFVIVIGLFTAVNSREYFQHTVEAFKPKYRVRAGELLLSSAEALRSWFVAQLMDMIVVGFMTAIGLWIVGVEYWALIGVLASVLCIIPYVGIILVVVLGTLITLAANPSQVPWVLLVFVITQQVEGNLILPMIMKGKAHLPEVVLLIFMFFMGTFFGFLGLFIAPPLLAVLRNLYIEVYLRNINAQS
jgi:predicted PurR-regulated permease PerM